MFGSHKLNDIVNIGAPLAVSDIARGELLATKEQLDYPKYLVAQVNLSLLYRHPLL